MSSFLREQTCRHGRFFYNINDLYVGRSLNLYGEWAESEVHLFSQIVRRGDVVLEAGANIGSHTVALSKLAGPNGIVHAFEPQTHAHQLLCTNLIVNGCVNTRTAQCALGAARHETEFPDLSPGQSDNFGAASLLAPSSVMRKVQVDTVDSLGLERLDFLKVDIEGYEPQLLEGARSTIERLRPIAFIESVNPYTGDISGALKAYFLPLGYRCWHYITPLFNPQNFNGLTYDAFPGQWSFDLLCVPPERAQVLGLDDAETHPTQCHAPEQWRSASVVYR